MLSLRLEFTLNLFPHTVWLNLSFQTAPTSSSDTPQTFSCESYEETINRICCLFRKLAGNSRGSTCYRWKTNKPMFAHSLTHSLHHPTVANVNMPFFHFCFLNKSKYGFTSADHLFNLLLMLRWFRGSQPDPSWFEGFTLFRKLSAGLLEFLSALIQIK